MALKVLRRIFDSVGSPWAVDIYGDVYCFFCLGRGYVHDDDCAYLALAAILGEEPRDKWEV